MEFAMKLLLLASHKLDEKVFPKLCKALFDYFLRIVTKMRGRS